MLKTQVLVFALITGAFAKFRVIREWNYVNFTWATQEDYRNTPYIPENNIIAGIKYFDGFYYITLPRMKSGVPATLTRIPAGSTNDTAPLLTPFPSWEMNNVGDCDALQNVQNVEIDPKGQIWIIDGGKTETLSGSPTVKCKPKLVVYDINKTETVFTYTFPENVASSNESFLYDIVIDTTDGGYAYITDNSRKDPGIIVYSVKDHDAWKIRHAQSMHADPNAVYFRVNGVAVNAPLNIAGITLGPRIHNNNDRIVVNDDREVFYAPISSLHIYSINTSVLKNQNFAMTGGEFQGQVNDYGLKNAQSAGMIMDNKGILYYSLLSINSIARWDSHTSFQTGQKIIAKDETFLEWPNSFTFGETGEITLLVNRLNRFIYDKLNISEPNFRLIASSIAGKSYLYDETYTYNNTENTENKSSNITSTTTEMEELGPLKPGTDQDPYLAPQLELEPKSAPEPEPSAEPEPEPSPAHSAVPEPSPEPTAEPSPTAEPAPEPTQAPNKPSTVPPKTPTTSGADRAAIALISLLTAIMMFVV